MPYWTRTVSIHAPTRGATYASRRCEQIQQVSIHAPTRGATASIRGRLRTIWSFNPRTHTGCDGEAVKGLFLGVVSIHAPTRGATGEELTNAFDVWFQSTHPHGVRLA